MKKEINLLIVCLLLSYTQTIYPQQKNIQAQKPSYIGEPSSVQHVPSIASRMSSLTRPDKKEQRAIMDERPSKYDIIIGKGSAGDDYLAKNPHWLKNRIQGNEPELVFETGTLTSVTSVSDPAGAVGPNHYFSVINTAFQVFDKNGNSLTGGLLDPTPAIFPLAGCCDLTVSYDNAADRWVVSILNPAAGVQIAVSDGPDPVNDGWTVYSYRPIRDYQKLSVWRDGYYITDNYYGHSRLYVLERSAMIDAAGEGTTPKMVTFSLPGAEFFNNGFSSSQVLNISSGNWPSSGGATVVYMQDDAWNGVTEDHIKLWNVNMDWDNVANSQISAPVELSFSDGVTPFNTIFDGGSFSNLSQPNGGISVDALQGLIMNQAQFRKFETYNSAIFNFTVDVDGSDAEQAGVRWYELRQAGDDAPWTIYQEGTYTAPDNRHAWNASMMMDKKGNIALGYTGMSSANSTDQNVYIGSYYTGRFVNDPLGVMTLAEETVMAGNGNVPGNRYGDYSKMDIDPTDDLKFWYVNEMMSNGGRKSFCGVFKIEPDKNNDVGIISIDNPVSGTLTNSETISVTIRNFGQSAAANFNIGYQINGGATVTETYTGTINPGNSEQYTFTNTADLSSAEGQLFSISAATHLGGDEEADNDSVTLEIIHLYTNDLGVTEMTQPLNAENLSNEVITVAIENFGTASQTNFNVFYSINGGTQVTEIVAGPLVPQDAMSYTFNTQGNFSTEGVHIVMAGTSLSNDTNTSNNSIQEEIVNIPCNTLTNDTQMPVGANNTDTTESTITFTENVIINDINLTLNLNHSRTTDLSIKLLAPDGTTEVFLIDNNTQGSGDGFVNTVFDSDAYNEITEVLSPFTGTFRPLGDFSDFNGLTATGDWKLVITDRFPNQGDGDGELLNWSLQVCTDSTLYVSDNNLDGDFNILNKGNDQYEIQFFSNTLTEDLGLKIYNIYGQELLWKTLKNVSGTYSHNLNMSYASGGVYLVRLGTHRNATTKRIVVE